MVVAAGPRARSRMRPERSYHAPSARGGDRGRRREGQLDASAVLGAAGRFGPEPQAREAAAAGVVPLALRRQQATHVLTWHAQAVLLAGAIVAGSDGAPLEHPDAPELLAARIDAAAQARARGRIAGGRDGEALGGGRCRRRGAGDAAVVVDRAAARVCDLERSVRGAAADDRSRRRRCRRGQAEEPRAHDE